MRVRSWHKEPEQESEYLFREAKLKRNAEISDRIKGVAFAIEGWTAYKISLKLDVTRQTVCRWVSWYNAGGIDGLWDKKYKKKEKRVSNAQVEDLRKIILAGPSEESGLSRFRAKDIIEIIKKKYQTEYSLSSVYRMLEDMGLSYVKPRPLHPKQDTDRLTAWKLVLSQNKKKSGNRGVVSG